jgi:hypothetical protein
MVIFAFERLDGSLAPNIEKFAKMKLIGSDIYSDLLLIHRRRQFIRFRRRDTSLCRPASATINKS